jgi:hypothetical protein
MVRHKLLEISAVNQTSKCQMMVQAIRAIEIQRKKSGCFETRGAEWSPCRIGASRKSIWSSYNYIELL